MREDSGVLGERRAGDALLIGNKKLHCPKYFLLIFPGCSLEVIQLDILRAERRMAYYKLFILPSVISWSYVRSVDSIVRYSSNQSRYVWKLSDLNFLEGSDIKNVLNVLLWNFYW